MTDDHEFIRPALNSLGDKLRKAVNPNNEEKHFFKPPRATVTLRLSPPEAFALWFALAEARGAEILTRQLDDIRHRQVEARQLLATQTRTAAAYREAARIVEVWHPKDQWEPFRFPIDLIGTAFDALTECEGQVFVGDEQAFWYGLEDGLFGADYCPIEPEEALELLTAQFKQTSVGALRKKLQRRKRQIAKLTPSQREAIGPKGLRLPSLSKLPGGPAYEKK